MSIEMATAFKAQADQDAGLRADVLGAYNTGGYVGVCEVAAGRGWAFTAADAQAVMSAPAAEGELSDLELEAVAGGKKKPKGFEYVLPGPAIAVTIGTHAGNLFSKPIR